MANERTTIKTPAGLSAEEAKQLTGLVEWHPSVAALLRVLERQHDVIAALVEAHNNGHYHEVGDYHAGQHETSEDMPFADEPAPAPTEGAKV